jgi:hypothetical protein
MVRWLLGLAALALPAAAAAAPCELHLFAHDFSLGPRPAGNLLVKALPTSDDPLAFTNIANPAPRMAQVSDTEYREALHLPPDTHVLRHWDVAVPAKVQNAPVPLIDKAPPCHAELIGYTSIGMMASRSRTGRNEVVVSFVYREFASGTAKPFEVRGGGYGAVDTEKKVGRAAALESLRAASFAMVRDFGNKVSKRRASIR